ncbi:hypothetical protein QBC39DRAFT_333506 [Podospora conica]|nr:hypothetical protein QBC39DRAFT_333506 [Schizothecium conicum]
MAELGCMLIEPRPRPRLDHWRSYMFLTCVAVQWRFVMGVGIGAEYPLPSSITAERSRTSSCATTLASVFMIQPVDQALSRLVGVWALLRHETAHNLLEKEVMRPQLLHEEECKKIVDGRYGTQASQVDY